jgi:hypothetical protein
MSAKKPRYLDRVRIKKGFYENAEGVLKRRISTMLNIDSLIPLWTYVYTIELTDGNSLDLKREEFTIIKD